MRKEKAELGIVGRHLFDSPLDKITALDYNYGRIIDMSRADYSYLNRPDPLREMIFSETKGLAWDYPSIKYYDIAVSPSDRLRMIERKRESPVDVPDSILFLEDAIRVVATIKQFSTMTTYQIAALLNISVEKTLEHLNNLYLASVIQRSPNDFSRRETVGDLWHLNERSQGFLSYVNKLESWERGLIQGRKTKNDPAPGANSLMATRHTVLTTETLIRALEYCDDVVAIWGEPFLAASNFYIPDDGTKTRKSHGDGAIITRDGKVIILETIGGDMDGNYFDIASHKAASWAAVCGSSDIDVSVIFLNFTWSKSYKKVIASVNKGLRDVSREYFIDEQERMRGINKVFVMDATRWFPEENSVTEDFARLMSWSPLHHRLMDPMIPDPYVSDHNKRFNVVMNSIMSLHSPSWFNNERMKYDKRKIVIGSAEKERIEAKKELWSMFSEPNHPSSLFAGIDGRFGELRKGDFVDLF